MKHSTLCNRMRGENAYIIINNLTKLDSTFTYVGMVDKYKEKNGEYNSK